MKKEINKKILIVEDDEDFCFILKKILLAEGFTVVTAKDGQAGADCAVSEKPDLIISDVLMPKMDGPSMARKIKECGIIVPIMFLTNVENEDESIKECDYLIKSEIHINEIVDKIKQKLNAI